MRPGNVTQTTLTSRSRLTALQELSRVSQMQSQPGRVFEFLSLYLTFVCDSPNLYERES